MLRFCRRQQKTTRKRNYVTGYKSAGDYIVKMSIIGESTIDEIQGLHYLYCAHFRTRAVEVLKIYHKITNEEIQSIPSDNDPSFIYTTGKTNIDKYYNGRGDFFCAPGIHFFLSEEPALYYGLKRDNYTGPYKKWRDRGWLYLSCNYVNGKKEGILKSYYEYSGTPETECVFVNDKLTKYKLWDKNGNVIIDTDGIIPNKYHRLFLDI